jgi:imidazolonepropionase-like amidohydrolase
MAVAIGDHQLLNARTLALVTALLGAPFRDGTAQHASQAPPVVIENVNVVPMDRQRVLTRQTVVIEGGFIARMGSASSVRAPAGAHVVDGSGRFLIPGLADVHVHLSYSDETEQRHILRMFVVNGVTSVLNMRGAPQTLELRSAVAGGRVLGPTIYTVGPYINEPFVTTPAEVERAVVEQRRAGYDFVKLHGDLSRDAYSRLNAVARREGIRVVGHAPRNLGLAAMFEERQYAVAHAEEFLYDQNNSSRNFQQVEPRIPDLARSMVDAGIWLMPNLTAYRIIGLMAGDLDAVLARPEMKFLPRPRRESWGPATNPYTARFGPDAYPRFMQRLALLQKLVRSFHAAGVPLLIGTDAMNTGVVPGFSTHDELAELVVAGLTPFEALRAATSNAAGFFARGNQRGVVAVGQTADLVLLDANPLENIANSRRIAGVMLRGRWLDRADLASILATLESPGN